MSMEVLALALRAGVSSGYGERIYVLYLIIRG